jgi:hypothetical protein
MLAFTPDASRYVLPFIARMTNSEPLVAARPMLNGLLCHVTTTSESG